jgi:DNA repair exonuclease SbcCD nuclease subunit
MKGNSKIHNQDCEDFVDWFIQTAKENNCDTGLFCGDWNHNRNSLNLTTMDSGLRALEKLGAAFENFYIFAGNHDLYYKDARDIKSTEFAKHIPGITVINDVTVFDDVALVPWLVNEEWKRVWTLRTSFVLYECYGADARPRRTQSRTLQEPRVCV